MSHSKPKRWPLRKLKDHPKQKSLFGDVSEQELEQLAAHMAEHGLDKPVEILTDGTIIAGHQRVRAARRLGWKEIDVVVRSDLEQAGPAAVETHLVNDNFIRRHLSSLARARCIRHLMEVETQEKASEFGWSQYETLKRTIAKQLGMSLRNVNRYLLVLNAPVVVQSAFDRGELTLTVAGRLALLPEDKQEAMVHRIENGESARLVAVSFLAKKATEAEELRRAFFRLIGVLRREMPRMKGQARQIGDGKLVRWLDVLQSAETMLAEIIARAKRVAS